jgi:hypothetical protein
MEGASMSDSTRKAAKTPNASGRKHHKAAYRRAVAGARTGRVWSWWLAAVAVAAVALSVFVVVAVMKSNHSQHAQAETRGLNNPPATTAVGRDTTPPWAAPTDAAAAVRAAGLPMLREEGKVTHIHAHLDVSVDGQPVVVPGGIGIGWSSQGISPLHTHNASGVIHIESLVNRAYTLGEFFTEWDVSLSPDNVGGLRVGDGKTLRVFVNGAQVTGNPAAVMINAHDEIAVIYGNAQSAGSIPSRYEFPSGL